MKSAPEFVAEPADHGCANSSSLGSDFSLVHESLFFRLQTALGLTRWQRAGKGWQATIYALLAWLPIAIYAVAHDALYETASGEPLLWHYGIHVRALVAIPILILAEGTVEKSIRSVVSQFSESGIVDGTQIEPYRCALEQARKILNSLTAQVALIVVTGTGVFFGYGTTMLIDESAPWLLFARNGRQSLTFAGWWYVLVLLPLFSFLALQWLWRWIVWAIFLRRVSKLKLNLVATHSDRCGGLLFLQTVPAAFAGFVFALTAVLASQWGHEVEFHGVDIYSFKSALIGFVLIIMGIFVGPLLVFSGCLWRTKRQALREYSALVARQGRLFHRRWIEDKGSDDEKVDTSDISALAGLRNSFEVITHMRPVPIDRTLLITLAWSVILPILPVIALKLPIQDVLKRLAKTLL
jgi:hypothetical protein